MIVDHKLVLSPYPRRIVRTPPRSTSPRCLFALVTNSSHSSLSVFRHLRTLSFSGSQLSRLLSTGCALFRKKPGVHPLLLPLSPSSLGTPFSRMAILSAFLLRRAAKTSPLSPFTGSVTQKQGGTEYWPARSGVEGSYQSSLLSTVNCRLLASPSYSPPCSTSSFPLQWGYPFPVITGENQ